MQVDSGSSDVTVSITTSEKEAGARGEGGMSVTYDSEDSAGLTVSADINGCLAIMQSSNSISPLKA